MLDERKQQNNNNNHAYTNISMKGAGYFLESMSLDSVCKVIITLRYTRFFFIKIRFQTKNEFVSL